MKPRYQVFISSTFLDLKDERAAVMKAALKLRLMPAGMEFFTAFDEDLFEHIKRVIDDSDFYVLVIGNRYGSEADCGLSYTEKEFDYAVKKGLKVMAFLHASPGEIPCNKSSESSRHRKKLETFRNKVKQGRGINEWNNKDELASQVMASLVMKLQEHTAVGWVRADEADNTKILEDLNDLRKRNDATQAENVKLRKERNELIRAQGTLAISDLAGIDETLILSGTYLKTRYGYSSQDIKWKCSITWRDLFCAIAPKLMHADFERSIRSDLAERLGNRSTPAVDRASVDDETFQTIKIQLLAHRLIEIVGNTGTYWALTPKGKQLLFQERTVKSTQPKQESA